MIPTIASLGPLPLYSFGLMIALALMVGMFTLKRSFRRTGIDPALADSYALWGGIGGLLGARVWNLLENLQAAQGDLWGAITSSAGFTFYGGFLTSVFLLAWRCRKDGVPVVTLAGAVGPTLAIGYAVGRLGCQLSGDGDYGIATDFLLGMSFATGVVPTPPGVLVHPTPFYESLYALCAWFLLDSAERQQARFDARARAGLYLVVMAPGRFLVEFLRIEPKVGWGLSEAQFISIGLFFCGALLLAPRFLARREPV